MSTLFLLLGCAICAALGYWWDCRDDMPRRTRDEREWWARRPGECYTVPRGERVEYVPFYPRRSNSNQPAVYNPARGRWYVTDEMRHAPAPPLDFDWHDHPLQPPAGP